jgi:hypothetical protein
MGKPPPSPAIAPVRMIFRSNVEEKGVGFRGNDAGFSVTKMQPGKVRLKRETRKKSSQDYRGAV